MPETLKEKECAACGMFFTPTHSLQKYCPTCGRNGYRIRKRIEDRAKVSMAREQTEKPKEHICQQCGKTFLSYHDHKFCSDACKLEHRRLNLTCAYCGQKIIDVRQPEEKEYKSVHNVYCSEECHEKAQKQRDIARFGIKTCPNCHKDFVSSNARFCSLKCSTEWFAKHKEKAMSKKICANCGKHYESHNARFCSKQCYSDYMRQHPNETKKNVPKESETEKALRKEQKTKERLEKYISENGMCGICRTSYVNCRRMQSNFTYSPDGCVIKNNKVLKCPQFIPPKKF